MNFLNIKDSVNGGKILADKIGEYLSQDKKVLWLLSGGSNISISVEAFKILKENFPNKLESNLAVTLTDERFGPVGYAHSNWQQLINGGFPMDEMRTVPVLYDLPLQETLKKFKQNYRGFSDWADVIVGQFGIGADGHIAGVLPETIGVSDTEIACAYDGGTHTRISLTLPTLKKITVAYAFVFGDTKKEIVSALKNSDFPLSEMPAQILKVIPEAYLYSDQL